MLCLSNTLLYNTWLYLIVLIAKFLAGGQLEGRPLPTCEPTSERASDRTKK